MSIYRWTRGGFFHPQMKAVGSPHPGGHGSFHLSVGQRRRHIHGKGDAVEDPLWGQDRMRTW